MSNKFKDIIAKNCTYYFFNDIISIGNFDPNNIKIDKKPQKIFLFTTLCLRQLKIQNTWKFLL